MQIHQRLPVFQSASLYKAVHIVYVYSHPSFRADGAKHTDLFNHYEGCVAAEVRESGGGGGGGSAGGCGQSAGRSTLLFSACSNT